MFFELLNGNDFFIISDNSLVLSIGLIFLFLIIFFAILLEYFSSPNSKKMFDNLSTILGSTEENLEELVVKQQKPKLDVLNNIASRKDNQPFPLSWNADDNEIKVGGKVYVTPQEANKFLRFYDGRSEDEQELMQKGDGAHTATIDLTGSYHTDMTMTQQGNTAQSYSLTQNCQTSGGCSVSVTQGN